VRDRPWTRAERAVPPFCMRVMVGLRGGLGAHEWMF
jgi:hypothetical protein